MRRNRVKGVTQDSAGSLRCVPRPESRDNCVNLCHCPCEPGSVEGVDVLCRFNFPGTENVLEGVSGESLGKVQETS